MQDGKCEPLKEQLEEHRLEIENRIRNLFWTVSGDYSLEFEPDMEDYARSKHTALYEAVKQGAFARHFDQEKLLFIRSCKKNVLEQKKSERGHLRNGWKTRKEAAKKMEKADRKRNRFWQTL